MAMCSTHAVPGVQAHGDLAFHRRLHQEGTQVQGKLADGPLVGPVGQLRAGLPLQGGKDQTVVGVFGGGLHKFHGPAAGDHHMAADGPQGQLPVQFDGDLQQFLLLSPVDGQDLVALEPGEGLGKVIVQAIDAVLLCGGGAAEDPVFHQQLPQPLAQLRVVGNLLGDNVGCPLKGVLRCLHALFQVDVLRRFLQRVRAVRPLGEEELCQRLQALLLRHRGPGAALLLVGAVQVLHLRQRLGAVDGGGQLLRQLALLLDGEFHRLPPFLEAPEVLEPFLQGPEGGVVHGAVELLAVPGDEGDSVALVQEAHHVFHMLRPLVQFPCNL